MPPRKRGQAGALAPDGDGDGAGPGPSSERAAAAAAGLLDVLEAAVLVELLDREAKRALRLASRAACAAVERMATRMELAASAQHDAMALQRLAAKLPNVNHLNCAAREEGELCEAGRPPGRVCGLAPKLCSGLAQHAPGDRHGDAGRRAATAAGRLLQPAGASLARRWVTRSAELASLLAFSSPLDCPC
jgi:hypothetical protein